MQIEARSKTHLDATRAEDGPGQPIRARSRIPTSNRRRRVRVGALGLAVRR